MQERHRTISGGLESQQHDVWLMGVHDLGGLLRSPGISQDHNTTGVREEAGERFPEEHPRVDDDDPDYIWHSHDFDPGQEKASEVTRCGRLQLTYRLVPHALLLRKDSAHAASLP